jgi:hypothetical protein
MTIRESWDDPVERAPLIERIDAQAYKVVALIAGVARHIFTLVLVIAWLATAILLAHDLSS